MVEKKREERKLYRVKTLRDGQFKESTNFRDSLWKLKESEREFSWFKIIKNLTERAKNLRNNLLQSKK